MIQLYYRWPGRLDNSITAGIPSGQTAKETLVKALRGALVDADKAIEASKIAGSVSYMSR